MRAFIILLLTLVPLLSSAHSKGGPTTMPAEHPAPGTAADSLPPTAAAPLPADSLGSDSTQASRFRELLKKSGKKLKKKFSLFNSYDTAYIEPCHYDWTAMVQNTNFFQVVNITAKDAGLGRQGFEFAPKASCKIGPYIGWKWIFLGYTFDMSRPKRAGTMSEFSFSLYSNMIGGDIVYIKNSGNFNIRSTTGFEGIERKDFRGADFSGLSTRTLAVNAYYVFNHKHFSYPAAYNQSTQQKRNAGSFILGFRFDQQRVRFDYTQLPAPLLQEGVMSDELKFSSLTYKNYCINVGYAYNWVFARNLLLGVSMTPSIGFKKVGGQKTSGQSVLNYVKNFNFDFIARAGLVWNTGRFFAGCSAIAHMYDYRRDHFSVANSLNYLNVYAGMYFGKWRP